LNGSSKGQLSTLDVVMASFIFVGIILLFLWSWGEIQISVRGSEDMQDYRDKAMDITDILLHTQGTPPYWADITNVSSNLLSIGLVSEPSVLDRNKLERFDEIPHDEVRKLFGLSKEDFYITVRALKGKEIYSFGDEHDGIAAIERMALLDDKKVRFELRLFKKSIDIGENN